MQAQDTIQQGNVDPANYQAIYDLYLIAFGREDLAKRAQSRAAEIYADRCINAAKNQR